MSGENEPSWVWYWGGRYSRTAAEAKEPPAAELTTQEPVEKGRLYGPRGETLVVAYDRRTQPIGFGAVSSAPSIPRETQP